MRGGDKISVFINSYTCDPCMISINRVIRSVGNIRWLKAIRQMLYAMFLKSEKYISVHEGFEKTGLWWYMYIWYYIDLNVKVILSSFCSCIEKWLRGQGGKCPQCNCKAHKKDIRVIYAKAIKV